MLPERRVRNLKPPTRSLRRFAGRPLSGALASLLGSASGRGRFAEPFEAAALRRSDAMKTALLRAVSHDFRSPLTAIVVSAGALAHGELSLDRDDRRELTETILCEAQRLDRLVSNLLDASRLEASAAEPDAGLWAIEDLILQALAGIEASEARIELVFSETEPAKVRVDLHQAERVLANLLENALRYSGAAQRVRVQVNETSSDVLIRVIDHGPGIAPGEVERIFEPFQRGSRTAEVQGAGLGLAIARGFAEANGGRVWAESLEGQGATFVFALPIATVEAESLACEAAAA
jgi:two-component system sensor histidine kinase KdpD